MKAASRLHLHLHLHLHLALKAASGRRIIYQPPHTPARHRSSLSRNHVLPRSWPPRGKKRSAKSVSFIVGPPGYSHLRSPLGEKGKRYVYLI